MIELKTNRLKIRPKPIEEIQDYIKVNIVDKELIEAMEKDIIPNLVKFPEYHLWYTIWEIILLEKNIVVGDCLFKGPPDYNGCIEIGYGIYPPYRQKGYMTEALIEFISWAFNNPLVKEIKAEVEKTNISSIKTLKKIGMIEDYEKDNFYWFKISK